jgi:hypothetical protein
MATDKQVEANRRNAQRSTGPRTAAGKFNSSRNSLRHGLSSARGIGEESDTEMNALALEIAGEKARFEKFDAATEAASAFLDIRRICKIRQDMLNASGLTNLTPQELWRLLAIDRYEARARTNLRRATRRVRQQS